MAERRLLARLAAVEPWFWVVVPIGFVTTGLAPILIPLEVEKIEGRALHVGVVMAAVGAGLLTAPLWTRLTRVLRGHRPVIAAGALTIAAASAAFCLAREVHEWSVIAFGMGSGSAAVFTVSNLLVMERYPPAEQDRCFGWLFTLWTVGTVLGLLVSGLVTHLELGVEIGFAGGAALAVGAALFARASVPAPSASPDRAEVAGEAPDAPSPAAPPPGPGRRLPFVLLVALWAVGNLGQGAIGALYPLLMRQEFGLEPAFSSYALAAATAVSTVLFVPASRLTTRFGGLAVLQGAFGVRLVSLAAIVAMALTAWFAHGGRGWLVFVPYGAFALTWPLLSVAGVLLVSRLSPGTTGPGLFDAASAGAFLVGPVVGGHVADAFGYTAVWWLALAGVAAGLALSVPLAAAWRRPGEGPAWEER